MPVQLLTPEQAKLLAGRNDFTGAMSALGAIGDQMKKYGADRKQEEDDALKRKLKQLQLQQTEAGVAKSSEEAALQKRLADPMSPESQEARASLARVGIKVPETASSLLINQNYGKPSEFSLLDFKGKQERNLEMAKLGKKANELKPLPPDKVLSVNEGNTIPGQLGDIRNTIAANKDIFGPVAGRMASWNPYNEKAQTIDAQMRASAQAFGRYMEGGVLRKEDEEKYRKMFPTLSDDPRVAANKLDIVEKMLVEKQQSNLGALDAQNYNIAGLDKGLKSRGLPAVLAGGGGGGLIPPAFAGQGAPKKAGPKLPAMNKVKVSNGSETLLIDPSDLADAQKDGYQVIK